MNLLERMLAERSQALGRVQAVADAAGSQLTAADQDVILRANDRIMQLDRQLEVLTWGPEARPAPLTPVQRARRVIAGDPLRSALTDADLEWLLDRGWRPENQAAAWITQTMVRP